MAKNENGYAAGPTILYGIGIVLAIIVVVKASIIGYYNSDLPWMLVCGVVAAVSIWVAQKWGERS